MCSIVGFFGQDNVVYEILAGLTALQHRGQDAAGVATFDHIFHIRKGLGLVRDVFTLADARHLTGKIGLGHTRYTTQGTNDVLNAQPMALQYPFGLAMVHNGNIINFKELREQLYNEHHILIETSNDLELILYMLALALAKHDLKKLSVEDIFAAVNELQTQVHGAYAAITIIANKGLLIFTDPHSIRPVSIARKYTDEGICYAVASETTCFDYLGYELIDHLSAGEVVFIDMDLQMHRQLQPPKASRFCIFEYIYFASEDSEFRGRLVATERVRMGKILAQKLRDRGLSPDIVIDVPSSGYFAASGLAEALGVPYRRGLAKNNHIGRSFISPSQLEREKMVKRKLNPIRDVVAGRKIAVVDDSIVRGTTSRRIVSILKEAGAKEVYFISAAPPIKYPCIYGIDMAITTELIAAQKSEEEICQYIGADALIYQSLDDLQKIYPPAEFCCACFNGDYPIAGSTGYLAQVTAERQSTKM